MPRAIDYTGGGRHTTNDTILWRGGNKLENFSTKMYSVRLNEHYTLWNVIESVANTIY